jgi:alkylhydroperoxidase family enzyme
VTTPRVELLPADEAKAAAEAANVVTSFAELSVFRVLLHHPRLAKAMQDLLITLLFRSTLDARLRELVIMRIGWVSGSEYEWTQHWRVAVDLGVSEDDLVAVRDWRSAGFGPAEEAVLAATDETMETGTISEATWRACEEHVGDRDALLELVVAIGHWRMYATLLRSLRIPLEDGVAPWPPDGRIGGQP